MADVMTALLWNIITLHACRMLPTFLESPSSVSMIKGPGNPSNDMQWHTINCWKYPWGWLISLLNLHCYTLVADAHSENCCPQVSSPPFGALLGWSNLNSGAPNICAEQGVSEGAIFISLQQNTLPQAIFCLLSVLKITQYLSVLH